MFNAFTPRSASAYQRINVETSMHTIDQHQLVSLLLEGLLQAVATARGALARGDVPTKCSSITKAVRILEEDVNTPEAHWRNRYWVDSEGQIRQSQQYLGAGTFPVNTTLIKAAKS